MTLDGDNHSLTRIGRQEKLRRQGRSGDEAHCPPLPRLKLATRRRRQKRRQSTFKMGANPKTHSQSRGRRRGCSVSQVTQDPAMVIGGTSNASVHSAIYYHLLAAQGKQSDERPSGGRQHGSISRVSLVSFIVFRFTHPRFMAHNHLQEGTAKTQCG